MAIEAAKIVIKIDSNAKEASRDMGQLGQQTKGAGEEAKQTTGIFKAFTAVAVAKFALDAARSVGRLAAETIQLASDAEETRSKFNAVFKDQAETVSEWASEFSAAVGRSTNDNLAFLASIQDTLVPLGLARDQASEMSKSVVELATDLSSFNNLPTEQVVRDIQSALVGNTETLRKYGVVANQSAIVQEALNSGLIDNASELDATTKAQSIYNLIVASTTDAQGDALRTANSYANQQRALNATVEDAKTAFGQALLPAASLATRVMNSLAQNALGAARSIRDWVTSAEGAARIGEIIGKIGAAFAVVKEIVGGLFEIFRNAVGSVIAELRDTFDKLRGRTEKTGIAMNVLAVVSESVSIGLGFVAGVAVTVIGVFGDVLIAVKETAQGFGALFRVLKREATFEDVKNEFAEAGTAIVDIGRNFVQGMGDTIRGVADGIRNFGTSVADSTANLQGVFDSAYSNISSTVEETFANAGSAASSYNDTNADLVAQLEDLAAAAAALADEQKELTEDTGDYADETDRARNGAALFASWLDVLKRKMARSAEVDEMLAEAHREATMTRVELLEFERDKLLSEIVPTEARVAAIRAYYQRQITAVQEEEEAERLAAQQEAADRRAEIARENINRIIQEVEEERAARNAALQQQVDDLRAAREEQARIEEAARKEQERIEEARVQAVLEREKKLAEARKLIAQELATFLSNIGQLRVSVIEREIAALKAQEDAGRDNADKIKQLEREKAQAQKRFALFNAIVSIAQGVAQALGSTIPPFNAILAGITAAAGAVQIATIAQQPIPAAQQGGSFVVPPGNNNDGALLRVSSGERVDVSPTNQSGGGSMPSTLVVRIGEREFYGAVEDAFNRGGAQIRNPRAVRTK